MLCFGCESCLLADLKFSEMCFELISNRLIQDSDENGELHLIQQLEICQFLVIF